MESHSHNMAPHGSVVAFPNNTKIILQVLMCVSFGDMLIVWCLYIIVVHFGERSHSMCIAGAQILQISILAKPRYDTRDKSNFLHCTSIGHICAVPIPPVIFLHLKGSNAGFSNAG